MNISCKAIKGKKTIPTFIFLLILAMTSLFSNHAFSQKIQPYVRIATLVIDTAQLKNYSAALKEHAQAAIRKEPGVLTLYAVYSKEQPDHVTVFEIYASVAAYQSHIQTSHFLKYKATVKDMVKSLVLTDVVPIALESKPGQ